MATVGRAELDRLAAGGCQHPGCDHAGHAGEPLYLHQRCHLGARVEVSYRHGSGVLRIVCAACHEVVVEVRVAGEGQP